MMRLSYIFCRRAQHHDNMYSNTRHIQFKKKKSYKVINIMVHGGTYLISEAFIQFFVLANRLFIVASKLYVLIESFY